MADKMPSFSYPSYARGIFDEDYFLYGIYGGRGSGKTQTVCQRIVDEMLVDPNARCLGLREILDSINESIHATVIRIIREHNLENKFEILSREIRRKGGDGVLFYRGLRDDRASSAVKSLDHIKLAVVDEAQDVSSDSLEKLLPTIRMDGAKILFAWNPKDRPCEVDRMFRGHATDRDIKLGLVEDDGITLKGWTKRPNAIVVKANYWDNPWCMKNTLDEAKIMKNLDYERYLHVYEGEYSKRTDSVVFKNFKVEEFDTPSNALFRLGVDFGFSRDMTIMVRCFIDPNNTKRLFIDKEVAGVGIETDALPAAFASIPNATKIPCMADGSRPETISYLNRHGYPNMRAAKKGAGSIMEGIGFLLSKEIIVHPSCKVTIDNLMKYRYKKIRGTDNLYYTDTFVDEDNHAIDALRYAIETDSVSFMGNSNSPFTRTLPYSQPAPIPIVSHWR